MRISCICYFFPLFLSFVNAAVTVYYAPGQGPLGTGTNTASSATYTGAAAYDPTVLQPPPVPSPAIPTQFPIQLQNGGTPGLSIQQNSAFFGFSIEFSVVNQVFGINSSFIQVPFLNLMSNIVQRAGSVRIRVGGNTQDTATLVDSLPGGKILQKDENENPGNPTKTPALLFTPEVLYMMSNISSLVNIKWYLGVPFNDSSNWRLQIMEYGERILGDNILGFQAANEPDLYVSHGHRPSTYQPSDYAGEFGSLVAAIAADSQIPNRNLLIGPSVSGTWSPEMVWDTGFVDSYNSSLSALAVEHYPTDNCFAQFGVGTNRSSQDTFSTFLNHGSGQSIVQPYINSTAYAQSKGKPFIMFETNTASCGGFAGLSDSYGAAIWGLDYGLQMAYVNFTGAMIHVSGQNVYYNPFTPPPTNQSAFHQWTIGPLYYSVLIMGEILGSSNGSQVLDLGANAQNPYTPAYAIYENGNPVRVALFNYVNDPSGASTYTAAISIGGGSTGQASATPPQVKVKYLLAGSVSQKGNFTWAGQTFGGVFESDGRFMGQENITTISCNVNNTCNIPVPAPGFALVFLADSPLSDYTSPNTATFTTTAFTKPHNTLSIPASVLATSNGSKGMQGKLGSTSKERKSSGIGVKGSFLGVVELGTLVVGLYFGSALMR